jgi:hypothetical protein
MFAFRSGSRRHNGRPRVTALIDMMRRLNQLQEDHPALRLYALVDGAQYETHRHKRLVPDGTRYPLFAGTPDGPLRMPAHGWWMQQAQSVFFLTILAHSSRRLRP